MGVRSGLRGAVCHLSTQEPRIFVNDLAPPVKAPIRHRATAEEKAERARLYEDRVEYVADMMRALNYRNGYTSRDLAVAWRLPESDMNAIVGAASKKVRNEYYDDRVISKLAVALEHVIDAAIESNDRLSVIKAAQALVQILGLAAPTKVQVSAPDLTALSAEQLQARKDELLRRLAGRAIEVVELKDGEG